MEKYIESYVTAHLPHQNSKSSPINDEATTKWHNIMNELEMGKNETATMLFCGAKNNGKSSLVRYLINNYNKANEKNYAYYVDFDPGQPELTTPGIVSAHIIRSTEAPLASPTYLNLVQHESLIKSCVGGLNMSVNPTLYIENCKFIFEHVILHRSRQEEKKPIFINTMGFIRGVGLAILLDLIKLCRPTHLVVLDIETDPLRTICTDLSPQVVDETRPSFIETTKTKKLNYKCLRYNLQFTFPDSTSIATRNRTALQLAYFANIPQALYKPIMQLPRRSLTLDSISIHCVSSFPLKSNVVLEIINQSWIHLVRLDNERLQNENKQPEGTSSSSNLPKECCNIIHDVSRNEMLGCGIVVEIDLASGKIFIITPLDQETVNSKVNCLIKPLSMQVPLQITEGNNM